MSSSEKVTEKLRENDKPPAYPVTRTRVTHFFFLPLSSFPPPLHFAFPPFPSAVLRLSSSSGLARSLALIAVCESPSPRFHRFPPSSTIFTTFIREQFERFETIEAIITIERFISGIRIGEILCLYLRKKKKKKFLNDLPPSPIKLYHHSVQRQAKSTRPIFLESNHPASSLLFPSLHHHRHPPSSNGKSRHRASDPWTSILTRHEVPITRGGQLE